MVNRTQTPSSHSSCNCSMFDRQRQELAVSTTSSKNIMESYYDHCSLIERCPQSTFSAFKGAEYCTPGNKRMCHWAANLFVDEKKNCRFLVRMINSQQQKSQFPKLPFQPYVHSVYACALPPADSDTDDLGTCPEHHPTLEPAASSSVNFRHSTALGPGSKGRLGVQLHSQAREGSKLEHRQLVFADEGYEGATSSMLTIYPLQNHKQFC